MTNGHTEITGHPAGALFDFMPAALILTATIMLLSAMWPTEAQSKIVLLDPNRPQITAVPDAAQLRRQDDVRKPVRLPRPRCGTSFHGHSYGTDIWGNPHDSDIFGRRQQSARSGVIIGGKSC